MAFAVTYMTAEIKVITRTHYGVNEKLDSWLAEIPSAPEGFHLIGIETSYISEGKDRCIRSFYFSDDADNHSFELSFNDFHPD